MFGGFAATSFGVAFCDGKENNVFAWGSSQYGQLGLGDEGNHPTPTKINSLKGSNVVSVNAGGECTTLLTATGKLHTFGRGNASNLGHGRDDSNVTSPKMVDGNIHFTQSAISANCSAAIDAQGTLYTWGRFPGREGDISTPAIVTSLEDKKMVSIACGKNHRLAVTSDGELYAWGASHRGQLGTGNKQRGFARTQKTPVKIGLPAGVKAIQVSAGDAFSAVLGDNGQVYVFGDGEYGQHGSGSSSSMQREPVVVGKLANKKIVQIAAGSFHMAALDSEGELYCWGLGKDGQVGQGTTLLHNTIPNVVPALKGQKVVQVACGGHHTAAITSDGNLWIWGRGADGQLGRADHLESVRAPRSSPVQVGFNTRVLDIALGQDYSVAVVSPEN